MLLSKQIEELQKTLKDFGDHHTVYDEDPTFMLIGLEFNEELGVYEARFEEPEDGDVLYHCGECARYVHKSTAVTLEDCGDSLCTECYDERSREINIYHPDIYVLDNDENGIPNVKRYIRYNGVPVKDLPPETLKGLKEMGLV